MSTPSATFLNMTADEHRAAATSSRDRAEESFQRCDTDGFLSQWASGITAQLHDRQASITENGGMAQFAALFDLDGNYVPAVKVYGQWGPSWALVDPATGRFTGFVGARPKRRTTLARKGYTEGAVLRPAFAATGSDGGRGLSGHVWVESVIKGDKWAVPAEVLYTDRFDEEES